MNNIDHTPDPEFVSRLEEQLQSEYRRRQRFDEEDRSPRHRYAWLRTAALVVVSLFVGAAGVKAAQHFENSWRKELLLARAEASAELAQARLQMSREMLDEVVKRVDAGLAEQQEQGYAELQVKQAEADLERMEIDRDEIRISGSSPRQELSAPLLKGRDFVSRRLQIEMDLLLERKGLVLQELEKVTKRHEAGVADEIGVAYAEQELKTIEQEADRIRQSLLLRRAFLNGELTARQTELQEMLLQAQTRSRIAQSRLDAHRLEMEHATRAYEAGTASKLDLRQFEFQYKAAETEARLAEMEVRLLEKEMEE